MKRIAIPFCALLVLLIPPAVDAAPNFESTVKIKSDENGDPPGMRRNYYPYFKGTVKSPKGACEPHRDVDLYRDTPSKDPIVGSDETNSHGKWQIILDKPGTNDYYARVLPREIGAGDCKPDRSKVYHHTSPF